MRKREKERVILIDVSRWTEREGERESCRIQAGHRKKEIVLALSHLRSSHQDVFVSLSFPCCQLFYRLSKEKSSL